MFNYLLRADLALLAKKTCVISKSLPYLPGCSYYTGLNYNSGMDLKKALRIVKEQKKQKVVTQVWRPVSTRSSSCEESMVKDTSSNVEDCHFVSDQEKHDIRSQVEEGHHTISSTVSEIVSEDVEAEAVNEAAASNPNTFQACIERSNVEGQTTPSVDEQPISVAEKHSISIETGTSLMRFIKGKGGVTQKKIEEDLGVEIIFPLSKKEASITIEGDSAESVTKAADRVKLVIDEAVKSPNLDYSHFVSLPLAIHTELVNKLFNFQTSILGATEVNQDGHLESSSNEGTSDESENLNKSPKVVVELKTENDNEHVEVDITQIPLVSYAPKASKSSATEVKPSKLSGIEKSTFNNPKTFHLTVLMLKLWNKALVEKAAEVLQSVSSKVIDALENRPVFVRLKGLECMKGSLANARVLYAPVEEIGSEGRLSRACQVIIDAFIEAGLVLEKDKEQKLKLHATVMNARHTKGKRSRKNRSFDARTIIKCYGSEEWGEYLIREAHLSQRFAYDENGYYRCCASIPFPSESQLD
nr:A-kinase anchor protein 7 isoform X4 [Ipomoea batatas]